MNVAYKKSNSMDNNIGYGRVYKSVLQRKNLSLSAKAVYGLLAAYCGAKDYCNPSLRTQASDLGCSRTTVVNCLKELRLAGCIIIKKCNNNNNEYHLKWGVGGSESVPREVQNMNQGVQNMNRGGSESVPNGGSKSEPKEEHIEEEHLRKEEREGARNKNNFDDSENPKKENHNPQQKPKEKKKEKIPAKRKKFQKPTPSTVKEYMLEKDVPGVVAAKESEKFWHHYESNGWKVGKSPMQKWKSAATGWINRIDDYQPNWKRQPEKKNGFSMQEAANRVREDMENIDFEKDMEYIQGKRY